MHSSYFQTIALMFLGNNTAHSLEIILVNRHRLEPRTYPLFKQFTIYGLIGVLCIIRSDQVYWCCGLLIQVWGLCVTKHPNIITICSA